MSSKNILISVDGLSKCYPIYSRPSDRLKEFIIPKLQRSIGQTPKCYFSEFWALRDVSFQVEAGETVGIIGRNGSGKSTLLQMICGTLNPTAGQIKTQGRIGALLELGSGFNPEFTGRENVYMNAAVLGLSREETDARLDAIIGFADIGNFIDQPVKTYSSGMMVRLAFAVQAQVSPDILIVDEALAVGDAKFQAKCFERLRKLKESGTSILLVTHSAEQIVNHCSRAILLEGGQILEIGEPKRVVNCYMDLLFGVGGTPKTQIAESQVLADAKGDSLDLNLQEDVFSTRPGYNPHEYRWGDGDAKILDFNLKADDAFFPSGVETGQKVLLTVSIKFFKTLMYPIFGLTLKTKEGITVYGSNTEFLKVDKFAERAVEGKVVTLRIAFDCRLATGDYFISLGIASRQGEQVVPHDRRYDAIHLQIKPTQLFFGLANLDLSLTI